MGYLYLNFFLEIPTNLKKEFKCFHLYFIKKNSSLFYKHKIFVVAKGLTKTKISSILNMQKVRKRKDDKLLRAHEKLTRNVFVGHRKHENFAKMFSTKITFTKMLSRKINVDGQSRKTFRAKSIPKHEKKLDFIYFRDSLCTKIAKIIFVEMFKHEIREKYFRRKDKIRKTFRAK